MTFQIILGKNSGIQKDPTRIISTLREEVVGDEAARSLRYRIAWMLGDSVYIYTVQRRILDQSILLLGICPLRSWTKKDNSSIENVCKENTLNYDEYRNDT